MNPASDLLGGFANVADPMNLLLALIGVIIGTVVGMLPGIGPAMTVALLLPVTYGMDPTQALILFAGIFYGRMYGGSTTSILLNTPGESSSVVTAAEGHKMAKAGKAAQALATTTAAVMLAALQSYGIQPGPLLFEHEPTLVWTLIASLFVGNLMLLVLNLPLAPVWAKLLKIPRPQLYAGILFFASMGAYAVNAQPLDLLLMLVLGLLGLGMRRFGQPVLPLIIGVVLGPRGAAGPALTAAVRRRPVRPPGRAGVVHRLLRDRARAGRAVDPAAAAIRARTKGPERMAVTFQADAKPISGGYQADVGRCQWTRCNSLVCRERNQPRYLA